MRHNDRWRFVKLILMIIIALQMAACQQKAEAPANLDHANKIEYTGPAVHRVRLTAKRAEELGIKTAPVREEKISGALRKVVPAAAVIRDQQGNTWTFKSPEPLVFVRERVSVESLLADSAILSDGPAVGTAVVTVGAAELFNDESSQYTAGMAAGGMSEGDEAKKSSGTATLQEDGSLKVVHRATGASGLSASVVVVYKPTDEEYQKIIDQIGGLQVGETKSVPPPR